MVPMTPLGGKGGGEEGTGGGQTEEDAHRKKAKVMLLQIRKVCMYVCVCLLDVA